MPFGQTSGTHCAPLQEVSEKQCAERVDAVPSALQRFTSPLAQNVLFGVHLVGVHAPFVQMLPLAQGVPASFGPEPSAAQVESALLRGGKVLEKVHGSVWSRVYAFCTMS